MKKLTFLFLFVLLFCIVGCNSAMRSSETSKLQPGMPGTLVLPNGEVVYDLNGKWDIVTKVGIHATFNGLIDIKQEGKQFSGNLGSGNFPGLETSQKVKGKLKGGEIEEIQFNTVHGWINSSGEILDGGKRIEIITQSPSEGFDITSTLKKK